MYVIKRLEKTGQGISTFYKVLTGDINNIRKRPDMSEVDHITLARLGL
jgi:hypothetical protein